MPSPPLLEWWANLLVSGATGAAIRPYLINLMTAIGPEEAKFLSEVWAGISSTEEYLSGEYHLPTRAKFHIEESLIGELGSLKNQTLKYQEYLKASYSSFRKLAEDSDKRGIPVELAIIERSSSVNQGHAMSYRHRSNLISNPIPVEVCLALKLLERHEFSLDLDVATYEIRIPEEFHERIELRIICPTELGIEFLSACQRGSVKKKKFSSMKNKTTKPDRR